MLSYQTHRHGKPTCPEPWPWHLLEDTRPCHLLLVCHRPCCSKHVLLPCYYTFFDQTEGSAGKHVLLRSVQPLGQAVQHSVAFKNPTNPDNTRETLQLMTQPYTPVSHARTRSSRGHGRDLLSLSPGVRVQWMFRVTTSLQATSVAFASSVRDSVRDSLRVCAAAAWHKAPTPPYPHATPNRRTGQLIKYYNAPNA